LLVGEREVPAMIRDNFEWQGERTKGASGACEECGGRTILLHSTAEAPYPYDRLSGLRNVGLVGVSVERCLKCRAESPIIPRLGELHRLIVKALVNKPTSLAGDEIRFLRKNAGFAAQKFAALIGVDPSHLSRVETGKTRRLGASADLLARAVVLAESRGGDAVREVLLDEAKREQIRKREAKKSRTARQPLLFTLEGNRWAA
jgi:transcriptional regulator with XRE-family HTH domain